jgi:hypothetical protein
MAVLRFIGSLVIGLLCWMSATTPEAKCGRDPLHSVPRVVAEDSAAQHQTLERCAKLRDPLIVDNACKSVWKASGQHFLEGSTERPDLHLPKLVPCVSVKPVPFKKVPRPAPGDRS